MTQRTALICGVSGQDGAYLAQLLLSKGYKVYGASRDATNARTSGLETLGIRTQVALRSMALTDFRSVLNCLAETKPDEIYNLSGQSSVGLSFTQPAETIESIAMGTLNLLEAVRFLDRPVRIYNAGSGECFGDTGGEQATEETPFRPRSPYAVAKACAHNLIANYREAYKLHCSTGILFNHESPLRPDKFVTKKIIKSAVAISRGQMSRVELGNLDIARDWGWAPEYVDAMWQMLQQEEAHDYVIATGQTRSLTHFVEEAFKCLDLNWQDHVDVNEGLRRPSDIQYGGGKPAKALDRLGWQANIKIDEVIRRMVAAELDSASPALAQ